MRSWTASSSRPRTRTRSRWPTAPAPPHRTALCPCRMTPVWGLMPSRPWAPAARAARGWRTCMWPACSIPPNPGLATLLRNGSAEFPKLADYPLSGPAARVNHLALKAGGPEALCLLATSNGGDTFRAESFSTGKEVVLATVTGLPSGCDYAAGNFRGSPLREVIFYKPGDTRLLVRPVEEPSPGSSGSARATASTWANRFGGSSPWPKAPGSSSSSAPARRPPSSASTAPAPPPRSRASAPPTNCSPLRLRCPPV